MNFLRNLAYKLQAFMYGRNGVDQLNYFIVIVYIIVGLLQSLFKQQGNHYIDGAQFLLLVIYLYRSFSKNLSRRRNENQKFCAFYRPIFAWIKKKYNRLKKMKEYKYFKCPNCKTELRVPRGKGNITVTCPKCRKSFDRKS